MKVQNQHQKKQSTNYFMYGKHAVFAAINNPKRIIKKIYCLEKTFSECKNKFKENKVEIVLNDFITKKIGTNQPHQGIIADVETIFLNNMNNLDFSNTTDKIVLLDQITDPQNIGAIIRSAAAFGITKLILTNDNTPRETGTIAKAASGCLEIMQIAKVVNLKSAIDILKKKNFWITGLDIHGKNNINDLTKFDKLAIIIGSEHKGMRHLTLKSCDLLIRIPISEKVESLNASNAASIIFHAINNNLT